jgi:hypothetical protein
MKKFLLTLFFIKSVIVYSQNDRINDHNNINWLQSINTIGLNKQWSLHMEYQWRRSEGLKYWQQSLLRTGVNYKLNDIITAHFGYAWIETFPYGDYPVAANGTFPEHRIYEQISFRQPIKKWIISHRFRIEQRWLGRVKSGTTGDREIEEWFFLHRFRYQFRTQFPFYTKGDKQFYAAGADEIMIGAGKNSGVNIFDQNRIYLLIGFKLNKIATIEAGYINQTLQQGRRINNNTIMQRNNGVVLSLIGNF